MPKQVGHERWRTGWRRPGVRAERLTNQDARRRLQINEIKDFLLTARRKDAKSVKVKKVGGVTKFKVRCSRYLYTLCVLDNEKAEKLKQSLPPGASEQDDAGCERGQDPMSKRSSECNGTNGSTTKEKQKLLREFAAIRRLTVPLPTNRPGREEHLNRSARCRTLSQTSVRPSMPPLSSKRPYHHGCEHTRAGPASAPPATSHASPADALSARRWLRCPSASATPSGHHRTGKLWKGWHCAGVEGSRGFSPSAMQSSTGGWPAGLAWECRSDPCTGQGLDRVRWNRQLSMTMRRPCSKPVVVARLGSCACMGSGGPRGRERTGGSISSGISCGPSATLHARKTRPFHPGTSLHVCILPFPVSPAKHPALVPHILRLFLPVLHQRVHLPVLSFAPPSCFQHTKLHTMRMCSLARPPFPTPHFSYRTAKIVHRPHRAFVQFPNDPLRVTAERATTSRGRGVDARVDMLVRVANSANGGSRRALPWAKVKEWPKKPPKPVLGVDPDVSGALAVLEGREEGWSLQIYDVPTVSERVGTRFRRRHCPAGIACALKNLELPPGCVAYVEMARPLPQNGRQGWYGSGFGYGVWMGALAAHGVETVAVHPNTWKKDMMLTKANQSDAMEDGDRTARKGSSMEPLNRLALKDRSREIAAYMFPQIMDEVKRKKDHGRAEALLLAAWGCGMRCESHGIEEEVLSLLDKV